eukprot:TRINITY_DN682_c0_g1_i1.p1 TRINITY_DN682_c0_g1~~TRINITY_DN682_c0_g1_i1.p1  ORF type:complete len:100 (+),score=9.91 TRINITY_DN682_c0_g1_i1:78-377(+)
MSINGEKFDRNASICSLVKKSIMKHKFRKFSCFDYRIMTATAIEGVILTNKVFISSIMGFQLLAKDRHVSPSIIQIGSPTHKINIAVASTMVISILIRG